MQCIEEKKKKKTVNCTVTEQEKLIDGNFLLNSKVISISWDMAVIDKNLIILSVFLNLSPK